MRVCVWAAVQGRGGVGGSVLVDIMLSQLSPLRVWSNNYAVTLYTKKNMFAFAGQMFLQAVCLLSLFYLLFF